MRLNYNGDTKITLCVDDNVIRVPCICTVDNNLSFNNQDVG